jgi:hypothetical protein
MTHPECQKKSEEISNSGFIHKIDGPKANEADHGSSHSHDGEESPALEAVRKPAGQHDPKGAVEVGCDGEEIRLDCIGLESFDKGLAKAMSASLYLLLGQCESTHR